MLAFSAIRETEDWSTTSVVVGLILLIVVIGLLIWQVRRFLNGPPA